MDLLEENRVVLRQIEEAGSDLSKPREIDFEHVFPTKEAAEKFEHLGRNAGFPVEVWQSDEGVWNATAKADLLPTAEEITKVEARLDDLAKSVAGIADGWGFLRID